MSNKKKTSSATLVARIMCIFLALLMVLGVVIMIVQYSAKVFAMSDEDYDNLKIRVGLMYGSDVTTSFEVKADYGFDLGYVDSNNEFSPVYTVKTDIVTAASDINLSASGGGFVKSSGSVTIGAYQILIPGEYQNKEDLTKAVNDINVLFTEKEIYSSLVYAFAAYDNGKLVVKVGDFDTTENLEKKIGEVNEALGVECSVSEPTKTSVMLINPDNNKLVFEFDGGGNDTAFGMSAVSDGKDTAYLKTPANNIYPGVFEFRRRVTSSSDGVALTNVLPIEQYIMGVQTWEINAVWHYELQKAFSIVVRTYTLAHLGRHKSEYGFDFCNTTNCQVYLGHKNVNDNVIKAVGETKGKVLTYNGKLAPAYYAAVFGGCSVSAEECWGGTGYEYMSARKTEWENYPRYQYGEWVSEITPKELCRYLNSKGYTSLKDEIASISIDDLAKNSSYVYQVTVSDIHGNTVTVKRTDSVRGLFSAYVHSANFVISKDGIIYDGIDDDKEAQEREKFKKPEEITIDDDGKDEEDGKDGDNENVIDAPKAFDFINDSLKVTLPVITSKGVGQYIEDGSSYIITSKGTSLIENIDEYIAIGDSKKYTITSSGISSQQNTNPTSPQNPTNDNPTGVYADLHSKIDMSLYNDPKKANGNFYIIGKGWGHGVGFSQYGAKDLAEAGISYDKIIDAYFTNIVVADYRKLK